MIRFIILILFFIIACEDNREWDNPYDPNSNRDFWTPQNFSVEEPGEGQFKLTWNRKGRPSNGYFIDRKVGEESWKNSILYLKDDEKLSQDTELSLIDTVDRKVLMNLLRSPDPFEYKYRIYAFAIMENGDTNVSNYNSIIIVPNTIPKKPDSLKIISATYINKPPKTMTVTWSKSSYNFKNYNIFHSHVNDFANKSLYKAIYDSNMLSLETTNFTVLKDNWFWIGVEDSMGQKTSLENSVFFLPIDKPPGSVLLDTITFENNKFKLKWSKANMNSMNDDFESYTIEEVTLPDLSSTFIETIDLKDDTETSISTNNDNETYFRVKLNDEWGNSSLSNIQPASSFQKIITLDFIRDLGDDLSIYNLGSTLFFSKKITNINAKFPIWIQNGKKIFALIEGGVGIVINEDGSGLKQFFGHEPQDISFNSDQTKGIYTGEDHNLYYIDLNTSDGEITINTQENNEWFSDPEIISTDEILYSQIKNPNLNNLGPQGIFTSGLDGNNVDTLLLEPSGKNIKGVRYLMPRMSPLKDKILYVKENDSLYLLEIDQNRNIISNNIIKNEDEVIVPEESRYFRNLRWSPDGTKAIFWAKKKSVYNLYIYDSNVNSSEARLLQAGARYGDWIENDKVLFHMDDGVEEFMFTKNISDEPATSATKLINDDHPAAKAKVPWAQLQPRQ